MKTQCERVILCFSERSLKELEGKHSDVRKELVTVREALSQAALQRDVLEEEKASLALALCKVLALFCTKQPPYVSRNLQLIMTCSTDGGAEHSS